jgi:hypothetical protein
MAETPRPGIPEPLGFVTMLPSDGAVVPDQIIERQAHTISQAAILPANRGVLVAENMLSNLLILSMDPDHVGQLDAYAASLDRLDVVVG